MKNIIISFSIVIALLRCVPENDSFFANSFEKAATVSGPTTVAYVKNVSRSAVLPVSLVGKSQARDIKAVTLFIEFIADGNLPGKDAEQELVQIQTYPDTVVIDEAKLLSVAGKSNVDGLNAGDRWIIKYHVTLTNGKILTNAETTSITFTCQSALAGTYNFSTTDITSGDGTDVDNCGGTTSGVGELEEVSGGVYTFSDNSFNLFNCVYDGGISKGTLTLNDLCGKISWQGKDQYGDTYTMHLQDNSGTAITFTWQNTYGDGGTTTLTRTDGKQWPLSLSTE